MINLTVFDWSLIGVAIASLISVFKGRKDVTTTLIIILLFMVLVKAVTKI